METSGLTGLELNIHYIMAGILIFFVIMLVLCLVRAIKGPRVADRIISVNMMGTMVIAIIAILAFVLHEEYLVDICLIYAMISFLAVVVLTKIYTGVYREQQENAQQNTDGEGTTGTDGGGQNGN